MELGKGLETNWPGKIGALLNRRDGPVYKGRFSPNGAEQKQNEKTPCMGGKEKIRFGGEGTRRQG